MIEIKLKGDRDNISKMLSRYRRKRSSIKLDRELRRRKFHEKKSVSRRKEIQNASYKLKKYGK
jgi:ribosomal protein S21